MMRTARAVTRRKIGRGNLGGHATAKLYAPSGAYSFAQCDRLGRESDFKVVLRAFGLPRWIVSVNVVEFAV